MDDLTRNADGFETDLRVSARRRRGPARARLALLLVVLAGIAAATGYWYATRNLISTDDAFTDGHAITIAPQVAGTVVALKVTDNQRVKAGQVLLEIDPSTYRAARDQAAANLTVARSQLAAAKAQLAKVRIDAPARLAAAQARLDAALAARALAAANWRRQTRLPRQATTQEAIDAATNSRDVTVAQVEAARAAVRQADTVSQSIDQADATVRELQGKVALAQAALAQATVDLSRTRVLAPQDGWITKRNVEMGNYVQPGQALLSIVTPHIWVVANFKESDLDRIHPGEPVNISVDAYPSLHLKGHVDSIQRGSGALFSAFPPENATGNFVKIVQRVPVKIDIDSGLKPDMPLPLGISVVPTIRLR